MTSYTHHLLPRDIKYHQTLARAESFGLVSSWRHDQALHTAAAAASGTRGNTPLTATGTRNETTLIDASLGLTSNSN